MEDEMRQVWIWYNDQLKKIKHIATMNIRSIHRAYRISWKNKKFMYTRIRKQYHERKLQLDRIKDTRISKIRNTIIPTTNKKALLVGINYEGTSSELKDA